MNDENPESRLKRLKMRSWRRGTKEMDMVLGPFADRYLADMTMAELVTYDAFLNENDQDLYLWVSGQGAGPAEFEPLMQRITTFLKTR